MREEMCIPRRAEVAACPLRYAVTPWRAAHFTACRQVMARRTSRRAACRQVTVRCPVMARHDVPPGHGVPPRGCTARRLLRQYCSCGKMPPLRLSTIHHFRVVRRP